MKRSTIYVGFVIDSKVPSIKTSLKYCTPLHFISGWKSDTAVSIMRFGWVADKVNSWQTNVHYELFRPWRKYSSVIFLKSMGADSIKLMRKLSACGVKTFFDANVDYFSPASGTFYYEGMAPSQDQKKAALAMAHECDGIIGDSSHITKVARQFKTDVATVEDNVKEELIVSNSHWVPKTEKLVLLWSGQAIKLFDILAIKKVLLSFRNHIHLKIVTNSLEALDKWYPGYKEEFNNLLDKISHEIIPFTDIKRLMDIYDQGGVFISPRYLDNSYNLGHTEWKITLPMARGRVILCSPQQSYREVKAFAGDLGVRICDQMDDWYVALEELRTNRFDWHAEQASAIRVVRDHYSTAIIARKHHDFIMERSTVQ